SLHTSAPWLISLVQMRRLQSTLQVPAVTAMPPFRVACFDWLKLAILILPRLSFFAVSFFISDMCFEVNDQKRQESSLQTSAPWLRQAMGKEMQLPLCRAMPPFRVACFDWLKLATLILPRLSF